MCLCFSSLTHLFIYYFFCSDRIIFAVKEASLLDQGSQGKQSIYQLEQVRRMSSSKEMLIKYGLIFLIFVIKFFELFFFVHHHYPQVHCIHGYCSKEQLLVDLGCIMGFFFLILSLLVQEISLLSQFEHENIVRYYGTNKVCFLCSWVCFFCLLVTHCKMCYFLHCILSTIANLNEFFIIFAPNPWDNLLRTITNIMLQL